MSESLTKVIKEDILASLDDDVRTAYEHLHNKITGQSAAFDECETVWRPSRLYLTQPTTSEDSGKPESANMGDFFYKGGIVERPVRFVVAYIHPSRVRFVPDVDRRPSCMAEKVDIRNYGPRDTSMSIYGDSCAKCPLDEQPFSHGKPTNCNNVLNALLIPEDLRDIFTFPFSKSSWSAGRQLMDQTSALPLPWGRFFTLDSKAEKRQNGTGRYAVPVVRLLEKEDGGVPEHLQTFAQFIYKHFREYRREIRERTAVRAADIEEAVDTDTLETDDSDFSDKM